VFSTGSLILGGVASVGYNDALVTLTEAKWDPLGNGVTVNASGNSLNLQTTAVYNGVDGQPFSAKLTVKATIGGVVETASGIFKVVVKNKTLDVEQNMAIDKGLWYLHTIMGRGTAAAPNTPVPTGWWSFSGTSHTTAAALQAFQINGHVEAGKPAQDPYVHDVARGLAYLQEHHEDSGHRGAGRWKSRHVRWHHAGKRQGHLLQRH